MAKNDISLIDLKALSKPATKLIEVMAKAGWVLYEPIHIRRLARVKREAAIIEAEGDHAVRALEARASELLLRREVRRLRNREAIVAMALDAIPESVADSPVGEDWITEFFGHCQDVGNETMQLLWARLLAGEVAQPGSFSLLTLSTVKTLTQSDAMLFTNLCRFVSYLSGGFTNMLTADSSDGLEQNGMVLIQTATSTEDLAHSGVPASSLLHLADLGLISPRMDISVSLQRSSFATCIYGGVHYLLKNTWHQPQSLDIIPLTRVGEQLCPLSGAVAHDRYRRSLLHVWKIRNIKFTVETTAAV